MPDASTRSLSQQAQILWDQALPLLTEAVNSTLSMKTWIEPLKPVRFDAGELTLLAPNDFVCNYARQYETLIHNTMQILAHEDVSVHIVASMKDIEPEPTPAIKPSIFVPEKKTGTSLENGLCERYTFDTFVVGSSNRFAHAACVAVANQNSGNSYNPLFLYGGSGLGKTHLMHAIGNHVKTHHPEKKLIYIQCEQFVNEFINTVGKGSYNNFRNKYRKCDILMIDDIQFIEKKEQMQVEFFNTYNALYEQGSNIVMTCDKPPNSLSSLEERLRTRFSSGLIVDINTPDYETRMAILRRRCGEKHVELPDDVVEYIASHIESNIRELEGACNTVMAYAALSGTINLSVAVDALKDIIHPASRQKLTDTALIDLVAAYYNLTTADIKSKRRSNDIAYPRQVAMHLLRQVLDLTYEQIGKLFDCHYSTVMHSCDKIEKLLKQDPKTAEDVEHLRQSTSA